MAVAVWCVHIALAYIHHSMRFFIRSITLAMDRNSIYRKLVSFDEWKKLRTNEEIRTCAHIWLGQNGHLVSQYSHVMDLVIRCYHLDRKQSIFQVHKYISILVQFFADCGKLHKKFDTISVFNVKCLHLKYDKIIYILI